MVEKKTGIQFLKFVVVGFINTGISLGVIYILMNLFDVKYTVANLVGYIVGVINSFLWSKLWVFKKKDSKWMKEGILFLVSFLICYGLQFLLLVFLIEKLNFNKNLSQLVAMGAYTACNFILNRVITFKQK